MLTVTLLSAEYYDESPSRARDLAARAQGKQGAILADFNRPRVVWDTVVSIRVQTGFRLIDVTGMWAVPGGHAEIEALDQLRPYTYFVLVAGGSLFYDRLVKLAPGFSGELREIEFVVSGGGRRFRVETHRELARC